MKTILISILFFASLNVFGADKLSKKDAFTELKSIDSSKDVIFATLSKDISNSYIALNKSMPVALDTGDEKLIDEVVRVAIYVSKIDPSHESGTHLLPLYETYKSKVDKALSKYPKKDRERIILHLQAAQTEGDEGNG